MPGFRYSMGGNWYKGNPHIHSTASDGGKTFVELAQMYHEAGYDFLCRADHWVCSDAETEDCDYPLLWLDGVELNGDDHGGSAYHVVCLGAFTGIERGMPFVAALEAAREQNGLLILAHPFWMGNSMDDALRWGFHGVEVYNHVVRWLNGKSDGTVHWNAMLRRFPNTLAFACDDAHIRPEHPGWNGGWIMVNAPECSREAVHAAIRAGNFYSTCGPEIHSLECSIKGDEAAITVRTSPVQFARIVGAGSNGRRMGSFEGELFTEFALAFPLEWPYAYLELEDAQGRRAWTNPLMIAEPNDP